MRRIYKNQASSSEEALEIALGGTGGSTIPEAVANLGLILKDAIDKPRGVIHLNAQGALDKSSLPNELGDPSIPSLYGPKTVMVNQAILLKITNYDSFVTYTGTASGGTVVVSGEDVTFTAGGSAGDGSVTLNGKAYPVTITSAPPITVATPSITSPVNGATGMAMTALPITSSVFSVTGGSDTHAASDWEIATDAGFTMLFSSSYSDTTNLTTWTVNGMQANTKYYVRTRQRSSGGKVSDWSAGSSFTTKAIGVSGTEQAKLVPNDPVSGDAFGYSVAVSSDGNTALIGAFVKTGTYSDQGAAYVFTRSGNTWTQQAKLLASDPASGDHFGSGVALSADGNTAIVGASGKGTSYGAIYTFTRSGSSWTQQNKFPSLSDLLSTDAVGQTIRLSADGNTAVVGVQSKSSGAGAAYVFTRASGAWTQKAKLTAGDPSSNAYFGGSVAISGDGLTILAGASGKTATYANQGAAYVFTYNGTTWSQQAKLLASDPASGDQFGVTCDLSYDGNTATFGAQSKSGTGGNQQGAAYVFTRSGTSWSQQAKLLATDAAANDYFGCSLKVSNDGNLVIVGAYYKSVSVANTGSAYIFTRSGTTWSQQNRFVNSDNLSGDRFGSAVTVSGDGLTSVSCTYTKNSNAGAAYVEI